MTPSVVDPSSQHVYFTGITDTSAYMGGQISASVTWQAGEYVKIGTAYYQVVTGTTTSLTIVPGLTASVANSATVSVIHPTYMDYLDNPKRPRTHFWSARIFR